MNYEMLKRVVVKAILPTAVTNSDSLDLSEILFENCNIWVNMEYYGIFKVRVLKDHKLIREAENLR